MRTATIVFVTATALFASRAVVAQTDEGNVMFRWGFGVLAGEGENRKFVSVTKDTALKSGDELKMVIELKKECFVYLIHESPEGEIDLLFPYELKQIAKDYLPGKNYYVPRGRAWFTLDSTRGRESFYLVASVERLTDLESLIEKYGASKEAIKPAIARDVTTEIRNLKKKFRTYATLAERPISIGGQVRGRVSAAEAQRPDVATIAIEISASNFYSKTFTIDHR
jgi:hypothetical protein